MTSSPPAARLARSLRARLSASDAGTSRAVRCVETVVFALLAPVVGALAAPADPLGLGAGFPWVLALPVVLAARYGSVWGGACALLASLACAAQASAYADRPFALVTLVVGLLVTTLAVGEIGLAWRRRSARAEAEAAYLKRRIEEFSNEYHVLRISHAQLRESVAGRRTSLREALQRLERAVPEGAGSFGEGFAGNGELMAVFAHFCSIQVAGLYAMRSPTAVDPTPVATHGDMGPLPSFDPLLRASIQQGKTTSVRLDAQAAEGDEHALLAVVPIIDANGRLHGVLAVREMHFMAFERGNLNQLALLGAWLGDRFGRGGGFSASPAEHFAAELDAALHRVHEHEVPASLVCVRMTDHADAAEAAAFIARNIRSLDRGWAGTAPDGAAVVTLLLPLSTTHDAQSYASRMLNLVKERFDTDPREILGAVRIRTLDADDTHAGCRAFIAEATGQSVPDGADASRRAA